MSLSKAPLKAASIRGFRDPFANLSFLVSIPDKFDVYADLYIASRPHASTMYGHEGYMLFKAPGAV